MGLIPGSRRSPGGGNGNLFQYSWLENPMDRGTWRTTVHGVAKSQPWLKQLITHTHTQGHIIAQLNLVPVLFIIAGWIFTFLNNRFLWHCEVCGLLFRMIFFYTCTQSSMYLLATMPCVLQTLEISQMTGPWELLIQLWFVAHSHIHNQGQHYVSVRGEWK